MGQQAQTFNSNLKSKLSNHWKTPIMGLVTPPRCDRWRGQKSGCHQLNCLLHVHNHMCHNVHNNHMCNCALLMPHSHCIAICLHSQYFILTTSHTLILHCCHVLTLSNNVGSEVAIWHHLFSPHSQVSHCQLLRCICISQMLHWSEKNDLESQNGPERTEPEFRYHGLIS